MNLKKLFVLLVASACLAGVAVAQVTLAGWTFETNTPADVTNNVAISGIASDTGLFSGTASGLHASAATDWTTPSGNGSANALSVNTWAIGDYFQFSVSTLGYADISASFAQISSSTGPATFGLFYSTNGTSFTQSGSNYTVLNNTSPNTWSASTPVAASNYSFDLSALTALDNQTAIYIRLVDMATTSAGGATVATGGTSRVDNFTITAATAIPEPSTYAALFGAMALAGAAIWRRRSTQVL